MNANIKHHIFQEDNKNFMAGWWLEPPPLLFTLYIYSTG